MSKIDRETDKKYYSLRENSAKFSRVNTDFNGYQAFMGKLTAKGRITNRLSQANSEVENMSAEEAGIALLEMTNYLKRGYASRANDATKSAWKGTMDLLSQRIDIDYASRQDSSNPLERSLNLVRPEETQPENSTADSYKFPVTSKPTRLARAGFMNGRLATSLGVAVAATAVLVGAYLFGDSSGYTRGYVEGVKASQAQTDKQVEQNKSALEEKIATGDMSSLSSPDSYTPATTAIPVATISPTSSGATTTIPLINDMPTEPEPLVGGAVIPVKPSDQEIRENIYKLSSSRGFSAIPSISEPWVIGTADLENRVEVGDVISLGVIVPDRIIDTQEELNAVAEAASKAFSGAKRPKNAYNGFEAYARRVGVSDNVAQQLDESTSIPTMQDDLAGLATHAMRVQDSNKFPEGFVPFEREDGNIGFVATESAYKEWRSQ